MSLQGEGSGPGDQLRAARLTMNVDVREVADALNLSTSVIEAIEMNAFEELPNRVFARGYLRAYAKLVELDPEPIVRGFSAVYEPRGEPAATQSSIASSTRVHADKPTVAERLGAFRTRFESRVQDKPLPALGLLAGALLVLFALIWMLFSGSGDSSATAGSGGVAVTAAQGAVDTTVVAADDALRGGFTDVSDAASDPSAQPVRLSAGTQRLRFRFVADCWVEVRSSDNRVLYSDLGKPNKQLELVGSGPFRILLGYAPGVDLAFNDEPVVLAPHTRNDLARLVLGQ